MNVFLHKIFRFTFQNVLDKIVLNFFVGGSSITDNRAWCPAVFLRHFLFQSMGVCSLFLALESIKLQPLCNIIHQHMKMNNMHISSSMYLKPNPPFFPWFNLKIFSILRANVQWLLLNLNVWMFEFHFFGGLHFTYPIYINNKDNKCPLCQKYRASKQCFRPWPTSKSDNLIKVGVSRTFAWDLNKWSSL